MSLFTDEVKRINNDEELKKEPERALSELKELNLKAALFPHTYHKPNKIKGESTPIKRQSDSNVEPEKDK